MRPATRKMIPAVPANAGRIASASYMPMIRGVGVIFFVAPV
jgi:hypothetical protein